MKRLLCLLLCLALMLGVGAQAQEIPEYNQLTVTMDGIAIEESTGEQSSVVELLPVELRIGLGADFDTARALCPRLYVLQDGCALGHELLMELLRSNA